MQRDLIFTRVAAQTPLEQRSLAERGGYYQVAWQIFKFFPWGIGPGNYTIAAAVIPAAQKILRTVTPNSSVVNFKTLKTLPAYVFQPVNNAFALAAVESGWLGALFYLALWLFFIFNLIKQSNWRFGLALGLPILIILNTDHWAWSLHCGWLLTCWLWSLVVTMENKKAEF